jgi:thiamine biosynthesis protein ThiI
MPEYCWVISQKPATKARLEQILEQEEKFDFQVLENAIENRKVEKLKDLLLEESQNNEEIETVFLPWNWEIVIDIRKKEDIKKRPLILENTEILEIDFTKINYEFEKLDQTKTYLFYCDKWVLSKLHWLYLKEKGFKNIKIIRPLKKWCELKRGEPSS